MKRRPIRRTRKRVATKALRKRPRPSRSKSARALDVAVKQLRRAISVTVARADSVLASSEAIAQLSATRTKADLVSSLLADEVLTSLYGLAKSDDNVATMRLLSQWLRDHLSLEPVYEQGQVLEIPQERLSAFDLVDGSAIPSASAICSVRIVAAGWKQAGKVLRKPMAAPMTAAGRV
jgi:hypothetical protein